MKEKSRRKFSPSDYQKTLYQRLLSLRKDNKLVQEYTEEFDLQRMWSAIPENDEQKAAQYVVGLRTQIQDTIVMHTILSVDNTYRLARRAEK